MTRDIHDALVKTFFSQRRHAASLFAALVPESVARLTDWSTLEPCPASFVDAAFGSHHADLLFVARQRGSRVPIYYHLEHQSTPERMLPCRAHGYRHGIWVQYRRLHPRSRWLPAIFTVVIYHGARRWKEPSDVRDLIRLRFQGARPALPSSPMIVEDLGSYPDARLRAKARSAIAQLVLFCLRNARRSDLLERIRKGPQFFKRVMRQRDGPAAMETLVRYILMANRSLDPAALAAAMKSQIGEEAQKLVKTVGERLIERGERKGLAKGRQEGREEGRQKGLEEGLAYLRNALLRLLYQRFGQVSERARKRIAAAPADQLARWAERVLVASSVQEVLSA